MKKITSTLYAKLFIYLLVFCAWSTSANALTFYEPNQEKFFKNVSRIGYHVVFHGSEGDLPISKEKLQKHVGELVHSKLADPFGFEVFYYKNPVRVDVPEKIESTLYLFVHASVHQSSQRKNAALSITYERFDSDIARPNVRREAGSLQGLSAYVQGVPAGFSVGTQKTSFLDGVTVAFEKALEPSLDPLVCHSSKSRSNFCNEYFDDTFDDVQKTKQILNKKDKDEVEDKKLPINPESMEEK